MDTIERFILSIVWMNYPSILLSNNFTAAKYLNSEKLSEHAE